MKRRLHFTEAAALAPGGGLKRLLGRRK